MIIYSGDLIKFHRPYTIQLFIFLTRLLFRLILAFISSTYKILNLHCRKCLFQGKEVYLEATSGPQCAVNPVVDGVRQLPALDEEARHRRSSSCWVWPALSGSYATSNHHRSKQVINSFRNFCIKLKFGGLDYGTK